MDLVSKGDPYNEECGWYGQSAVYWSQVPATVDGVLTGNTHGGDMGKWHEADIEESRQFIESIRDGGRGKCIDCGAGMGRVTRDLLCPLYSRCDVLESQSHMLEQAERYLADQPSAGDFILGRLESVPLPPRTYDLVFLELAAMYLTDADLVTFLKQAKVSLTKKGFIFLKENCAKSDKYDIDPEDNGLLRTEGQFAALFQAAGLTMVR
ncbi:hypothetical protein AGDE_01525, partial [Angomonas deanei]